MSDSNPDDPYMVVKKKFTLKGASDGGIKKKKKSKKQNIPSTHTTTETQGKQTTRKTKAELIYEQRKLEKEKERILKKASQSHKEKVGDFNRKLDALTEHFDIPKVSWTK